MKENDCFLSLALRLPSHSCLKITQCKRLCLQNCTALPSPGTLQKALFTVDSLPSCCTYHAAPKDNEEKRCFSHSSLLKYNQVSTFLQRAEDTPGFGRAEHEGTHSDTCCALCGGGEMLTRRGVPCSSAVGANQSSQKAAHHTARQEGLM